MTTFRQNFLIKKLRLFFSVVIFISGIIQYTYAQADDQSIDQKLAALETSANGHLGISAVDTANNQKINYRADERFPMGCTAKVLVVSAVLKKSMTEPHFLEKKVNYKKEDLVTWSPITERHISDGMTVADLSSAALTVSDNTATNLLINQLGGIQTINTFLRATGDHTSDLNHRWPDEALAGGEHNKEDSSTPAVMQQHLQQLAFGNILTAPLREQLITWLKNNTTGNARIRAGVPKGWMVGDKTGTGIHYGTTNDIGIIWPPHCKPIILAIYFTHPRDKNAKKREDILATATQLVINELARNNSCLKQALSASNP